MLNHVVLMGEITEINKNGVLLQIDDKTIIQINLSPRFQELVEEHYSSELILTIKGSLVLDNHNHVSVEASVIQFHNKDKEEMKSYQNKDISR